MRVLVVDGSSEGDGDPALAALAQVRLTGAGHDVDLLTLADQGFDRFMSADERRAYHEQGQNLLTPGTQRSAELLRGADALIMCCAVRGGAMSPMAKSWFERVFVPGVSFTFTSGGRVTGALTNIRRVGLIVDCPDGDREAHRRTSSGRSVLRGVRLNAHRFCRTTYAVVRPGDDPESVVRSALAKW
ncbi:MAG: NAD(P)H-dependent oxidoreductase [Acidimicrobiales bacterium]